MISFDVMINYKNIFTLCVFAVIFATAGSNQLAAQDSTLYVQVENLKQCVMAKESKLITYDGSYNTLKPFMVKLDNLIINRRGNVNIWHVGGSHVQGGSFSQRVRSNFAAKVNGGIGSRTILFPYKLIGTNGPIDYKVSGTGSWSKAKCTERSPRYELGLSGVAAVTSSPGASVTFELSTGSAVDWTTRKISVLGTSHGGVTPYLVVDENTIECVNDTDGDEYYFEVPDGCNKFTVKFHGLGAGNSFELRGVIAQNDEPGVNYWASGVNGAATSSWLRCSLLEEELKMVTPDMVIFGIGINDAHTPAFKPEKFKANYQQILDKIKAVNPNCHFVFVTNNDNLMKNAVNPNTEKVEKAFMELAQENDGSVWDLYQVMGGFGGSRKWVASSLMQKDHIHFTRAGYHLIGDLLYNAVIEEYLNYISDITQ